MLALIRTDWRTFRPLVIGSTVLCGGPHLLCAAIVLFAPVQARFQTPAEHWLSVVGPASVLSMLCLAGVAAAFGGTAWAAERAERSATFIDLLPPTRIQRAASKLGVSAGWLLLVLAANVVIFAVAARRANVVIDHTRITPDEVLALAGQCGSFGVLVFGVAWACSTFLDSSGTSALIGFVTGAVVAWVVAKASHGEPWPSRIWASASLSLGVAAFLAGTAHYLRRTEP
jgi:ABC-type transport system involved in multi-copper enzyme maturation permease subunit